MIRIENLSKAFDDHVLFDDFSIDIDSGEYVVFSGNSGSGKTTLLNMIGSLEGFDSGTIVVDGMDISKKKNQQAYLGKKVGFIFQNFALLENKTVRQNLELIKPRYRTEVTIEQALARVGLPHKIDSKVYTLSGGEQQRIALARLMIKKCDLILCDEPTGSLDKKNADNIMSLLQQLNDDGKTILLVTHDEYYKSLSKRIVEL